MPDFMFAMGDCIVCKKIFQFNPHKVPSTTAFTGTKEPVCRDCMEVVNIKREAAGQEPFAIDPKAYEPIPEGEW